MITLSGITKRYGAVTALDEVSLEVREGEIIALAGENGSGKSTLVKALSGVLMPDSGSISIDGEEVHFSEPRDALERGISLVAQELTVVPALSVYENVMLPILRGRATRYINRKQLIARTRELLGSLGLHRINPRLRVEQLGPVEQTFVEIAKALVTQPRVLILDEATSRLSAEEVQSVLELVRSLRDQGLSTVMITHRISEMTSTADRAVVLRDGHYVGELSIAELTEEKLVRMMVGRDLKATLRDKQVFSGEQQTLVAEGIQVERGGPGVSFSVGAGEIVGLAGLVGAGRTELLETIYGLRQRHGGTLVVNGSAVQPSSVRRSIRAGLSLVPEERRGQGLIVNDSIENNYHLGSPPWNRLVRRRRMRKETHGAIARFGVKARNVLASVSTLSGGNQQKVVIAKWLATRPKVIILDEPTKGIDVGSKAAVHDFIGELAGEGLAVVLISSELPEVMGLADRILVLKEGRIVDEFRRGQWSAEKIVSAATGASREAA